MANDAQVVDSTRSPRVASVAQAVQAMADAGKRAPEHGVEALRALCGSLPPPIRDLAIEMMLGFDAGSVAATTHYLARNEQPIRSIRELEALDVPVMVLLEGERDVCLGPSSSVRVTAAHRMHAVAA